MGRGQKRGAGEPRAESGHRKTRAPTSFIQKPPHREFFLNLAPSQLPCLSGFTPLAAAPSAANVSSPKPCPAPKRSLNTLFTGENMLGTLLSRWFGLVTCSRLGASWKLSGEPVAFRSGKSSRLLLLVFQACGLVGGDFVVVLVSAGGEGEDAMKGSVAGNAVDSKPGVGFEVYRAGGRAPGGNPKDVDAKGEVLVGVIDLIGIGADPRVKLGEGLCANNLLVSRLASYDILLECC